ncbi:FISUMP domain-containing protein [Dysgonomonas sp. ZJ709]|uniref:FISUMP domain-containing protein n=1 Tax=Dysgonomonas sp. ZJ709 TaxID=2709797 RepID=UPI0013EBCB0D|nr:FISUMP domain-containing protein [Dysgonomonas sp. ZJ709]
MKFYQQLLILFLLASLFGRCTNEDIVDNDSGAIDRGDKMELNLTVRVPGIATPATYALDETDEYELETIDVLVFKDNNSDPETFLYATHATDINNAAGSTSKSFKVLLKKSDGSEKHRVVLLANLRNEIDAVKGSFTTNKTKAEVLDMIRFTSAEWKTDEPDRIYLPMWGETGTTYTITANTNNQSLGLISLLRSVARIDVGLNFSTTDDVPLGLGSTFNIKSVAVYNSKSEGLAAPMGAVSGGGVVLPSISDGISLNSVIKYEHAQAGIGFIREIYASEYDNKSQSNDNNMFCIVVGGYYNGSTSETYYRIDFYDRSSSTPNTSRLDILRNYRYKVNITSVGGSGYQTPDEAFLSRPVNMTADVTAWNESFLENVATDGQYYLSVNKKEFTFARDASTTGDEPDFNALLVETNYPTGWKVDKIVGADGITETDWLTLSTNTGAAGTTQKVFLQFGENTGSMQRKATIWLTAGRISYPVQVTQTNEYGSFLDLKITDNEGNEIGSSLAFSISNPIEKIININWLPTSLPVNVTIEHGSTPFDFGSGSGMSADDITGGSKQYTITPSLGSTSLKSSTVTFTITRGTNSISKSVSFAQGAVNLNHDNQIYYGLNGQENTITIKTNTSWAIREVIGDTGILLNPLDMTQYGGNNEATGYPLKFSLKNSTSTVDNDRTFYIILYDPTGKMGDTRLQITGKVCGSNGNAVKMKIGNNEYLTHQYGDKCWMVENSIEGTTSLKAYDGNSKRVNGYYYTSYLEAPSACPAGWRLPEDADVTELINIVNATPIPPSAKWWVKNEGNPFAGNYNPSYPANGMWFNWGLAGYWWTSTANRAFTASNTGMSDPATNYYNYTISVRCVRN